MSVCRSGVNISASGSGGQSRDRRSDNMTSASLSGLLKSNAHIMLFWEILRYLVESYKELIDVVLNILETM
jgi:hypothetical protein